MYVCGMCAIVVFVTVLAILNKLHQGQEYAIVDEHSDPPAGETLQDDLTKIKATEASPYSKVEPVPTTNSHSEDEPSQTVESK